MEGATLIKSIQKAVSLLVLLSEAPETPVPLGKLAQKLGINSATCLHILQTLCDSLLVERVSRKEGYRLGPGTYMLSRHGYYQKSLVDICIPVLKWLNRQLDCTVFLSIVCDGIKYLIYHIDGNGQPNFKDLQIVQGNIERTASGILMMAYMDEESYKRVIYRSKTLCVDSIESYRSEYQEIRKRGYAEYLGDPGKHSYAFPIFNGSNRPIASVGVLYLDPIDTMELREKIVSRGKYASAELSRRLAFSSETFSNEAK